MSNYGDEHKQKKSNPDDENTDAGNSGGTESTDTERQSERDDTKQQ